MQITIEHWEFKRLLESAFEEGSIAVRKVQQQEADYSKHHNLLEKEKLSRLNRMLENIFDIKHHWYNPETQLYEKVDD